MALGVRAGPARTEGESQEPKGEGLAPPNPVPLLKFTPPRTQSQCPLVAKYSIAPFLHPCIPSRAMGLVPAWPGPPWLQGGKVGARSGEFSLTLSPGPPMGPGSPLAPVRPCKRRDGGRLLPALLLSSQTIRLGLFFHHEGSRVI